jgi:gluconolactonase
MQNSLRWVLACMLIAVPWAAMPQGAPAAVRGDATIVAPDAKVERIYTGATFTEGPAQAADGALYFSQITVSRRFRARGAPFPAGHIWRLDPRTGQARIFRSPSGQANGITFDLEGRMLIAEGADFGGRRITRTDLATGESIVLAAQYNGRPFNAPNDLIVDAGGRIYFTDPRYFGPEPVEQPVQGVYRIDPDGKIALLTADAGKANGIVISPDQRTLYVSSLDFGAMDFLSDEIGTVSGPMALYAYDLSPAGALSSRRVLKDFAPGMGPDGITVDRDGNLYLAVPGEQPDGQGIHVISARGEPLAFIPIPESPTNVKFGRGADARTLFVTSSSSVYRVRVLRSGFHPGQ